MNPVVNIYGRKTVEYLFECISKLNVSPDGKIIIRAYARNVGKGIKIAQILQENLKVDILKTEMKTMNPRQEVIEDNNLISDYKNVKIPYIEIPIKLRFSNKLRTTDSPITSWIRKDFGEVNFLHYASYQLLLDWYFSNEGSMEILTRFNDKKPIPLLKIYNDKGITKYQSTIDMSKLGFQNNNSIQRDYQNKVFKALYRSGVLLPNGWKKIAQKLSRRDDVILGLDTNILYNCSITEHILPAISVIENSEFVNTPNWILLIVPSTVMYELEHASNFKDEKGNLTHAGIQAYRALQEFLDLSQNIDITGVSILITGETNPLLDHHNTLKRMSKNLYELANFYRNKDLTVKLENKRNNLFNFSLVNETNHEAPKLKNIGRRAVKSSSEDMLIRNQFKQFLNQINFHKNSYFLTADKASSALSIAEGLNTLYIKEPSLGKNDSPFSAEFIRDDETICKMNPPLGTVVYEMAIEFGTIYVKFKDKIAKLSCDKRGDVMGRWLLKQLSIHKEDLSLLLDGYKGKFHLGAADKLFEAISKKFGNPEMLSGIKGAFNNNEHSQKT